MPKDLRGGGAVELKGVGDPPGFSSATSEKLLLRRLSRFVPWNLSESRSKHSHKEGTSL